MSLEERFDDAADKVKKVTTRPSNDELLELYGLFKQATVGDNNTSKPWGIQFEALAKWNAWTKNNGITKEQAMEKYIDLATGIIERYST